MNAVTPPCAGSGSRTKQQHEKELPVFGIRQLLRVHRHTHACTHTQLRPISSFASRRYFISSAGLEVSRYCYTSYVLPTQASQVSLRTPLEESFNFFFRNVDGYTHTQKKLN